MPRFSVVVHACGPRRHLRACLESVLLYPDAEVVVALSCGDGRALAVARELAGHAPHRVRIAEQGRGASASGKAAVVPGARASAVPGAEAPAMAGVRAADGDYLLVMDADDVLLPGALAALDAALKDRDEPDVLLFDHESIDWWQARRESPAAERAALRGTGLELLCATPVLWNRVVHRRLREVLLAGLAVGELCAAYRVLLEARSSAVLPEPCLQRRKVRRPSGDQRDRRCDPALLTQYDAVLATLPDGLVDPRREAVHDAALRAVLEELAPGRACTRAQRTAFRREFLRLWAGWRPCAVSTRGLSGPRVRALLNQRELPFEVLRAWHSLRSRCAARRVRDWSVKRVKRVTRRPRRWTARQAHRVARLLPVQRDLVLYNAYWNRSVSCNPAAIHRKARELAPHLRAVWVLSRPPRDGLPVGVQWVRPNSARYWWMLGRAGFLVTNSDFGNPVVKRRGQRWLQTHHGSPLKLMGFDQRGYPASCIGLDFGRLLTSADQWDWGLSSNPHSTEVWDRVYHASAVQLELGYPRNDVYATATAEDVRLARERLGLAPDVTVLLYAPTHRDYRRGLQLDLDLAEFCRRLGPGFVVLARAHYFYGANPVLAELERRGVVRDVSAEPAVEPLCLAADALVTDYSSLVFDFANLNRPVVVHAPDWQAYRMSRGVYFDLLSGRPGETPGPVTRDLAQLVDTFRSGAWRDEHSLRLRAAFRERFCPWDDGRAAERVVRHVLLGQPLETLPRVIPVVDRRHAPTPAEAYRATAAKLQGVSTPS